MRQEGLVPTEHHQMLTEMADSFNAGILAAENNEVSNTRSNDDPHYQAGVSLIGKDNVPEGPSGPGSQTQTEQAEFNQYSTAPIQHQLDTDPNFQNQTRHIPMTEFKSPVGKVTKAREAAAVMQAAIGNHGQEAMTALVTDDAGNILNIIRHAKGSKDTVPVFMLEI